MLTFSGLLTDRRPCARSSRLLRSPSRSSTSRNRKKTSLHSGWVSNNLQSDTRRTEFTQKHPTAGAGGDGHVTSVVRVCSSLRQFILPQVFWAEIWLSPLHPILLLVICNQPVDIFFVVFYFFGEPPQQEPPGLLWLTTPPNQFSLTAELLHCAAIQSESSPASSWAAASSGREVFTAPACTPLTNSVCLH